MRRFFDIILSGLALAILSPVFMAVILVLRCTGEREVFFLQERVGKKGKTFKIYKFATMLKDSPNTGAGTVTLKNDPRVLPIGKILRRTKINELPQLINIFNGDMSVIGPRPQTRRCFNAFPLVSQKEIIRVRPGLSGIGSIFFRNEEDMLEQAECAEQFYDNTIMPYKGKLEEWYVSHRNILNYFILIGVTIFVIFGFNNKILSIFFPDLPKPPQNLAPWV
ncbi:sugar transferase [Alphaproteobacteria bacterium]|nr:sugar transferase [Alphaproteobacteria bacterium]